MTLHLIKLSVGSESVESLAKWQAGRLRRNGRLWHFTRMMPKRRDELLDGGSIYWVIKGLVQARQRLLDLERDLDEEGRAFTRIVLDPPLVRVVPKPFRAFQGWRYLAPADAPPDLAAAGGAESEMPPEMLRELKELGLL